MSNEAKHFSLHSTFIFIQKQTDSFNELLKADFLKHF